MPTMTNAGQQTRGKKQGGTANLTNAGKGRRKGVPNRTTAALKDMILKALDEKGGAEYLARQADKNPAAFMTLLGKVLPMTVAGDPDNPLKTITRIELVGVGPQ